MFHPKFSNIPRSYPFDTNGFFPKRLERHLDHKSVLYNIKATNCEANADSNLQSIPDSHRFPLSRPFVGLFAPVILCLLVWTPNCSTHSPKTQPRLFLNLLKQLAPCFTTGFILPKHQVEHLGGGVAKSNSTLPSLVIQVGIFYHPKGNKN